MSSSKKLLPLAQRFVRELNKTSKLNLSTTSGVKSSETVTEVTRPQFKKLKENQKRFQIDNDEPVYKKGGLTDKILLQLTTVLVIIGLGLSGEVMYKLAFPPAP